MFTKNSKFLILITFLLLGVIVGGLLVASLSIHATKKISEGDSFLYSGKLSEALENYELAQKLWPFLYKDFLLNQKIHLARETNKWVGNAPALTIFFKNGVSESEIQAFGQEIKNVVDVREVKYVSKEDAFGIYTEQNKDNPELVKLVSADILPASLEVHLSDLSIKGQISRTAKAKSIVEEVVKSP